MGSTHGIQKSNGMDQNMGFTLMWWNDDCFKKIAADLSGSFIMTYGINGEDYEYCRYGGVVFMFNEILCCSGKGESKLLEGVWKGVGQFQ